MDIVQRPLQANGTTLQHGEVILAEAWKHASKLRDLRYIREWHGEPITCTDCGRFFSDEEALALHMDREHRTPSER